MQCDSMIVQLIDGQAQCLWSYIMKLGMTLSVWSSICSVNMSFNRSSKLDLVRGFTFLLQVIAVTQGHMHCNLL